MHELENVFPARKFQLRESAAQFVWRCARTLLLPDMVLVSVLDWIQCTVQVPQKSLDRGSGCGHLAVLLANCCRGRVCHHLSQPTADFDRYQQTRVLHSAMAALAAVLMCVLLHQISWATKSHG